jgi:hypothetical protein
VSIIRKDPTASVLCFHMVVSLIYRHVLRCALTPDELPPDGVASLDGRPGLLGQILAHYSVKEVQQRGSFHLHAQLVLLANTNPFDFYANLAS